MSQIAVRLSDAELRRLDQLVGTGPYRTRAEAVRAGIALLEARIREQRIAENYRTAYTRAEVTHDEEAMLDAALRLAVDELP
jgi:Arc/MetJ-type ribon-helix-helix transcriptional regulator